MNSGSRRVIVFIACVLPLIELSSCAHKRPIAQGPHPPRSPLLTATKTDLLRQVAAFYDSIHSLKIVADLTVSRGSVYKGEIVDHSGFQGHIDIRKPGDIRVVALLPLVYTTAFSMVSDGGKFRAYLNSRNRFIEGEDDAPATSPNQMENMRPRTFLSALLVKPLDSAGDFTLLLDDTNEQYSHYILQSMRKSPNNDIELLRTITFDRVDLRIIEQREYAPDSSIVSLTKYDGWKDHSGIDFPSQIRIMRYLEEYGATLDITQLEINNIAPDSTFILERPEGSTLQVIGGDAGR
jgi:outer membrane lipoprotein-sorting protein